MKSEIEVPNGWRLVKISDVSKTYAGGTPSRYNKSFFNGDILWVKSGEVDGQFIEETSERITEEALQKSSAKIIPENTVLIAMYGATAGKVGFLKKEGASNQAVLAIPDNKMNFNSLFMYYLLSSKTEKIMKTTQGTGQPNLSKTLVERTRILLPTLKEQQKITDILSKVDEQIDFTEKIIDKTRELKKGLMRKLLTKGVGHNEFIKIKIGTKTYEIPLEWNITTTKETLYMKGRIGWKGLKKSEFTKEGPFLITGVHFKEGKIDWENCFHIPMSRYVESPEIQIKNNDVLLTKDGTIGKVAYVDDLPGMASLNSHLLVLRPLSNDELFPRYLYYVLRSNLFKNHVNSIKTGSTLAGLSQSNFGKFKYFVPKLDEQKQIASILSKVDEQIQDNKKELKHLQGLKKGLMQDLLTGKVRVAT